MIAMVVMALATKSTHADADRQHDFRKVYDRRSRPTSARDRVGLVSDGDSLGMPVTYRVRENLGLESRFSDRAAMPVRTSRRCGNK